MSGIYTCDIPLFGNNVGIHRSFPKNGMFMSLVELRAYEMPPMALTVSMLSTNSMPNTTLGNSITLEMGVFQRIRSDSVFTATGERVYWMVNFGSVS